MGLMWIRDVEEEAAYQKSIANPSEKVIYGYYTYYLNGAKCGFSPPDPCVEKHKSRSLYRPDVVEMGTIFFDRKKNMIRFALNVQGLLSDEQHEIYENWAFREMKDEEFMEFVRGFTLIPKKSWLIEQTTKLVELASEKEKPELEKILRAFK